MQPDQPEQTQLATSDATDDTPDDLAWAGLEIQRAQRQIVRGVSELAEGIVAMSLALLEVRRRRLYRFDPEYATFERYVEQRHGISADQARIYVDALTSLGEAQYRSLIADLGLQRTYALAMLKRADPTLVTAFQMLPTEERRAVTVTQIEAVDAVVTSDLRTRVAELEQAITRDQGLLQQTRRRLQEAEELHQRVASGLIEERDTAQRALDDEQRQADRLRKLLAEARQTAAASVAQGAVSQPPPPGPAEAAVTEAVLVVVTYDVPGLLTDVRALTEKLSRLAEVNRDDIPAEQRRELAGTLQSLLQVIRGLLSG
jgi:hypothetical protein